MGATANRSRAVDHRPTAVDAVGKKGRVLVVGRHDGPKTHRLVEVAGHCQRDERAPVAVCGVGDRPFLALGQPGEARVFAAPDLLGMIGIGRQQGVVS